jgi:cell division transport system ATP-binding protein
MTLLAQINELGTTMLVVTHERGLVNHFNKRVIRIEDGVVVGDEEDGFYIYEHTEDKEEKKEQ